MELWRFPEFEAYQQRERERLTRLDEQRRVVLDPEGDATVDNLSENRLYFEQIDQRMRSTLTPFRVFLVPGVAMIQEIFGFFFVGFRRT